MKKKTLFAIVTAALCIGILTTVHKAISQSNIADEERFTSYTRRFVTYNICGLPDMIVYDRNLDPAKKRMPRIGERLRIYDIMGLQEVFVTERYLMEKKLRNYYVARGADSEGGRSAGSGIYIFSKQPVIRSHFERWEGMVTADAFSLKGFVGTTIEIGPGLKIDVYNFHAQAGGYPEIRTRNYDQMYDYMYKNSIGSGRPIIVMGDFNCEYNDAECKHIRKMMDLKHVNPLPSGIDHIFYNQNNSRWKIQVISFGEVLGEKTNGRTLSDHNGFEAILKFSKK